MIEASNEGGGVTAKVCLIVEGILWEDDGLIGDEGVLDETSTVFENETGLNRRSAQHVEEFGGTRVVMGRSHSTRSVYVKDGLDRWGMDRG